MISHSRRGLRILTKANNIGTAVSPHFILASGSSRRLQLLNQIGIIPDLVISPNIDETYLEGAKPRQHTSRLSMEKASVISIKYPNSIILSADTIVIKGNKILSKPTNASDALNCIKMLSGGRHRVITSVCIIDTKENKKLKLVQSIVKFKSLSAFEIDTYIESGEWRGKAGGYAIQGLAAQFIPWISGSYTNIVGLPIFETSCLLYSVGLCTISRNMDEKV